MSVAAAALVVLVLQNLVLADAEQEFEQLSQRFEEQFDAEEYRAAEETAVRMQRLAEEKLGNDLESLAVAVNDHGRALYRLERFDEAERCYQRAAKLWSKALGPDHVNVAIVLENLGHLCASQERYDEAAQHFQAALAIRQKVHGAEASEVADVLVNLADMHAKQEQADSAERGYKRALEIYSKARGAEHPDVATTLMGLGILYHEQGRHTDAESQLKRALEIREKALGAEHVDVAAVLSHLAESSTARGNYAEAEPLLKRMLAIDEKCLGADDPEVAADLTTLALFYQDTARFPEAEPLLKRALEIREKALTPEDIEVAWSLYNLARLYRQRSIYAQAEPLYRRALKIFRKANGSAEDGVVLTLNELAFLNQRRDTHAEAERLGREALETAKSAFGPTDSRVADCSMTLGGILEVLGRYEEAEKHYQLALDIREKEFGPDDLDVAESIAALAAFDDLLGRYAEGEPLHRRALTIRQKELPPGHPGLADSYLGLANSYYWRNRYAEAEPLYKQALGIYRQAYGTVDEDVATCLNNLAVVYYDQGRYDEAEPLLQQALETCRKVFGAEHRDVAMYLMNLADLYREQERYEQANDYAQRALVMYQKILGPEHVDTALAFLVLAELYRDEGRPERQAEAERLYQQALAAAEKSLGPEHPGLALALNGLAKLYEQQGQYTKGEPLLDRAIAIHGRSGSGAAARCESYWLRARLAWKLNRRQEALGDLREAMQLAEQQRARISGAERERAKTFAQFREVFEQMVAWQVELGDAGEALAAIESGRARSLLDELDQAGADLEAGRSRAEREQSKTRELELRQRVAALRKQLQSFPTESAGRGVDREAEQQLRATLGEAEAALYEHYRDRRSASPVYRTLLTTGSGPPRLSQLQRTLLGNQDLLLMYLLGKEGGYVLAVGPEQAQLSALSVDETTARALGIDPGPLTAKRLAAALTNEQDSGVLQQLRRSDGSAGTIDKLGALWRLLVPDAQRRALTDGNIKRLILVPDGQMALLPLETLVVATGTRPKFLLDVGPAIQYGASATVLYNLTERRRQAVDSERQRVLTVGNPRYEGEQAPPAPADSDTLDQLTARTRYTALSGRLAPLPYSGWESGWVVDAFGRQGIPCQRLTGPQATEANVRSEVRGRQILHLACHGLADQSYGNFYGALALTPGAEDDPSNDGFLTLAEIYQLDLKSCDLAILSACETNCGPQQQGEGVWALSRGFLVAGARRVVASNWLVDDEAAASLVYHFCRTVAQAEKAGKTPDYADALHKAKLWIRNQEKWQSPYYWGTFVLMGPN